jgi:succinyl-CoA synthetase alpha subunit
VAVAETGAFCSLIFVRPAFRPDAVLEVADAGTGGLWKTIQKMKARTVMVCKIGESAEAEVAEFIKP